MIYSNFEGEMTNAINLLCTNDPLKDLKLCYEITPGQQYQILTIMVHFKSGADVELYSINTFLEFMFINHPWELRTTDIYDQQNIVTLNNILYPRVVDDLKP